MTWFNPGTDEPELDPDDPGCAAETAAHPWYGCTLPHGHAGVHIAQGDGYVVYAVWNQA